jgi:hypothetical protein
MMIPDNRHAGMPMGSGSGLQMEHSYSEIAPTQTVNAPYGADGGSRLISTLFD